MSLDKNINKMSKMCMGKSAYKTYDKAEKYRKKAENERGLKLRVYGCPVCQKFHLTSKPLKEAL